MGEVISVIVPVYNVEKYLERCVNSILEQTYRQLQIILVDDGSTDQSGKICDAYAEKEERIKVVHKINGGLSDARNAGMEVAVGEYVCFFDSDDWIEKDTLKTAYDALKTSGMDIAVWGFVKDFVDHNENVENTSYVTVGNYICKKEKKCNPILLQEESLAMIGYAWNKLYKVSVISNNNFRFEKGTSLVEDILFNKKVLSAANGFCFIEGAYTHYMQRNRETLGAKFYSDYYELKLRACKAREELLSNYGASDKEIEKAISRDYFSAIKSSIRMACKSSDLSKVERRSYIEKLCKSEQVQETLRHTCVRGKDRIFKISIKFRLYFVFEFLYSR